MKNANLSGARLDKVMAITPEQISQTENLQSTYTCPAIVTGLLAKILQEMA